MTELFVSLFLGVSAAAPFPIKIKPKSLNFNVNLSPFGLTMFAVFEARKENLGSDEGGQSCTGANS
jgi:hypothetical protein